MVAIKTITVRLPGLTYERLCKLADISEELPSETARRILKEFLGNFARETPPAPAAPPRSGAKKLSRVEKARELERVEDEPAQELERVEDEPAQELEGVEDEPAQELEGVEDEPAQELEGVEDEPAQELERAE